MISGRDIICISSIEWGFLWQCPQEIAWRLAQNGNRVLYIENSGVRAPGLRDAGRVWRRLKGWAQTLQSQGVREVAPNVYVCSPLVMPPFGARWQARLNRHLLLPAVRRAARKLGMRDALLWTYLPTDTANNLIELLREPESVLVYYCLADFSRLTPNVEQLRRSEQSTIEMSDVVFTNCAQLSAYCGQWHGNVHVFPPGVNLEAFPLDDVSSTIQPPQSSTIAVTKVDAAFAQTSDPAFAPTSDSMPALPPSPVIGYIGGLHRFVDMDLLIEMARARTAWSWVFVGSVAVDASKLSALPNVHLLGQQPHKDLNKYLRRFDACIVPYLITPETETVVPTKINEYLAAGKPVVSTELPTVLAFNAEHDVVFTAEARSEPFLQAIEHALATSQQPGARARRREVAALNDWQARLATMSDLIEIELEKKRRVS